MVSAEQESLRRFLRGLCSGDGFLADDIAQEALLKAYISFERFEGRSRFSTWLFRIAYNCFYDHMHKQESSAAKQDKDISDLRSLPVTDASAEADRKFEYQQLYYAIGGLNRNEQAVILLFYMEDKSIKEISAITGLSSAAVRMNLYRGRKHVKQFLKSL